MDVDASVVLRILNNERLRSAQGYVEIHDLGGVSAKISDAPLAELNCLESFDTTDGKIEGLLDVGFSLLRAFDRDPAAYLTPLDRPKSLVRRLKARGLREVSRALTMIMPAERALPETDGTVEVRRAAPEDAQTFSTIHAGNERWVKRASLHAFQQHARDPSNAFYLGYLDGQPCGTTHLLIDGVCAGIYAVMTVRAQRGRGVATALIARAVEDARAAGCEVVFLRTNVTNEARRLFERLGFEAAFETVVWSAGG